MRVVKLRQNAVFEHQPRHLKHNRRKGDFLRQALRLVGGLVFLGVAVGEMGG